MDCEKLHKDTLEIGRKLIEKNPELREWVESKLPELKESEDERIRKELIGGLMWQRDNLDAKGPHDNNLILPGFTMKVGDILAWFKKQKDEAKRQYDLGVQAGKEEAMYELEPAKWGDEDSPYYDDICEILINLLHSETTNINKDVIQKDLDWFKSLPERFNLGEKKEWSREDKVMFEDLKESVIKGTLTSAQQHGLLNFITKIQSIRPQPHWKPSKEQINVLKVVARGFPADDPGVIDSLLADLQKLL